MSERAKFILEWERRWRAQEGRVSDVSRQTGYVWIRRYQAAGHDLRALEEQSRRPHTNRRVTPATVEDLIVATRKLYLK